MFGCPYLTIPNTLMISFICFCLYKIIFTKPNPVPVRTPVKKRQPPPDLPEMTLQELVNFDGIASEKIYVGVNGYVYDVTSAKHFYGPGGPYQGLAARDASRALAVSDTNPKRDPVVFDDISDLTAHDLYNLHDWEKQFRQKYSYVAKLVKEKTT